jgi:glutamyl-tRNA reductase
VSLVVIGLNHRSVPLDLLERMTIEDSRLPKALHDVVSRPNVSEAVVLSTCNRTEIYVVAERFHGAFADVRDSLGDLAFLPPEAFADHLYVHYDLDAARHLFEVAAGLDSAVVGESEILGQVRHAWARSRGEKTAGPALNALFRHAVEVGKRARSETGISRNIASVSTAAVAMATERLARLRGLDAESGRPGQSAKSGLEDRSILVLGAGDMGAGMTRAIVSGGLSHGAADVRIANRTWARAVELADSVGPPARAIRLGDVDAALAEVDLLLTGTGAQSMMLELRALERVMAVRQGRPLLIVDVAVPRDVDPEAGELEGVTLLDMNDLRSFADAGRRERAREVAAVQTMIASELDRFGAASSARSVAPLVGALHEQAESVRQTELDRHRARLAELDEGQRAAVDQLTRAIVAKLLHGPTVAVKDAAGSPRGERLADSLRELFTLDDDRETRDDDRR